MCVDDSPEILEICESILEAGGYQVFTARTGAEALELIKVHLVDAVVVDNVMPGMNGMVLAERIKALTKDVLVVMYGSELNQNESFPGIDSCLYKGRGPLALRALLDALLQK